MEFCTKTAAASDILPNTAHPRNDEEVAGVEQESVETWTETDDTTHALVMDVQPQDVTEESHEESDVIHLPSGSVGLMELLKRCVDTGPRVDNMDNAVEDVQKNGMSIRQSALKWGVAKTTLAERLKRPHIGRKCGRTPALKTTSLDESMVELFLLCAEFDVFISKSVMRPILTEAAAKKGAKCTFGGHWIRTFHAKHAEVVQRRLEAKSRRKPLKWTPQNYQSYMELLIDLNQRGYLSDPSRIFYVDQTDFQVPADLDTEFVAGHAGLPALVQKISVIGMGTASGQLLEPMVLVDGQPLTAESQEPGSTDQATSSDIKSSRSGLCLGGVDLAVFADYVRRTLVPYVKLLRPASGKAVLFLTDNHSHCKTIPLLRICIDYNMMAVVVPHDRMFRLVPWNLSALDSRYWTKSDNSDSVGTSTSAEQLDLHPMPGLLLARMAEICPDRNVEAEFIRYGIYPFNETLVRQVVEEELAAPQFPISLPAHGIWLRDFRISLVKRFGLTKPEGNVIVRTMVKTLNGLRGFGDYAAGATQPSPESDANEAGDFEGSDQEMNTAVVVVDSTMSI